MIETAAKLAEQRIRDILDGKILVGLTERRFVERHVRDLETGARRNLKFRADKAERALGFFQFLRHSKGEWAGQRFDLAPWQALLIWVLFGWYALRDGEQVRRFTEAYVQIARKNGKSTLAAGIALYMFVADGESGAEVYTAATKRDQAKIVWREAQRMVRKSPPLAARIEEYVGNLSIPQTDSLLEPLGADADTLDGLNVSCAVLDELHAHKRRELHDVLETATGARRSPLLFNITTAGTKRDSICSELYRHTHKILSGALATEADDFLGYVAELDAEDAWDNPEVYGKANPNLGVSVKPESLLTGRRKAIESLPYRNSFVRLRLNRWTQQVTQWIDLDRWNDPEQTEAIEWGDFVGRECYIALDLSSTIDLSTACCVFPNENGSVDVLPYFFMPEDNAAERAREDRVPFPLWIDEGYIRSTPGDVIDYEYIRATVNDLARRYHVREIVYDPWNATDVALRLQNDGHQVVQFAQTIRNYAPACRHFEALLQRKHIRHAGHPVLRWNAGNVAVKETPNGDKRPVKGESVDRIDGIVGLLMALGRILDNTGGYSVYEGKDLLIL